MKKKTKIGIAAAAATGAAALGGAGAYYFYGSKDAKKHRAKLKALAKKAEREVKIAAKKVKKEVLTNTEYKAIVSQVVKKYQGLKDFDARDIREFADTLHGAWKRIEKELPKAKSKGKKVVKKVTKKKK